MQKFYLHDAATTNTGTLPAGEHSSQTSNASATPPAGNTTQRTMDGHIGTSQATATGTTQATTTAQAILMRMFESNRLAAQTIAAGTWALHIGDSEANASSNFQVTATLYVWRPGTGAVVGTIFDASTLGTEPGLTETATTVSFTGSAVTCQAQDILVLEIWRASVAQAMATAYTNTINYDGTAEDSISSNAAYLLAPADLPLFTEDSPGLEASGFGTFTGIGPADTINSVTASINQWTSDAGMAAPTYQLWDGTTAQIGSTAAGAVSASTANTDTPSWTGVTYSQLGTLRLRVYAHSGTAATGAAQSVDYVSLTVSYTPAPAGLPPSSRLSFATARAAIY